MTGGIELGIWQIVLLVFVAGGGFALVFVAAGGFRTVREVIKFFAKRRIEGCAEFERARNLGMRLTDEGQKSDLALARGLPAPPLPTDLMEMLSPTEDGARRPTADEFEAGYRALAQRWFDDMGITAPYF